MTTAVHEKAAVQYGAFYSSVLGGITTNPAFMCIPMDDHMVSHPYKGGVEAQGKNWELAEVASMLNQEE